MAQPAYVNVGVEHRFTVSSGGVSGLTIPMPAAIVPGNFLLAVISTRPSGTVATNGFSDDTVSVTGSGVWSLLAAQPEAQGIGGNLVLYGKHATGGEGDLKALLTAVGVGGNGVCYGQVAQFSNVANPGDLSYFEGLQATGQSTSGRLFPQDISATGGSERLLVQIISAIGGGGFSGITGMTVGDWTPAFLATTVNPRVGVWTSTDTLVAGGGATTEPGGNNPFTALGFAFAPCGVPAAVGGDGGGYSYLLGGTPEGGGRRRSHGMPWWIKWRRAA